MKLVADQFVLAPTDLRNFLGCRHLTSLDAAAARGEKERPLRHDPRMEALRERGQRHEGAYLDHLRQLHRSIAGDGSQGADASSADNGLPGTLDAMRQGVDVIYQATLADDA